MIKRTVKIVAVVCILGLVVIQFFGIDKTNPRVNESETLEMAVPVPADIAMMLARSCNDCHSNKTIYPWYANVQPAGWFLRDHIDQARSRLNFSTFRTYSVKQQAHKLEEICEMVESREMPLTSYLWLHRDAALTESDAKALCDWAKDAKWKLEAGT